MNNYENFQSRFKLLVGKNQHLIVNTLSNIFTMRLIGNKTHGDLAEIGIVEFINQFMYDFKSVRVGKDLFRAKDHEEDIVIIDELSKSQFPVSLKAHGDGPLQLSTDKNWKMFPYLEELNSECITSQNIINSIFESDAFKDFGSMNVMPLIYDEKKKRCNILIYDYEKAKSSIKKIQKISQGHGRKHPVYAFLDANDNYIAEVRYGNAAANALQRGLWTHTKKAQSYFNSLTNGWIDYSHNLTLVNLFGLALVATENGHSAAKAILQNDIEEQKTI